MRVTINELAVYAYSMSKPRKWTTAELIENLDLPQAAGKVRRDFEAWLKRVTIRGCHLDPYTESLLFEYGLIPNDTSMHGLFMCGDKRIGWSITHEWLGAATTLEQLTAEARAMEARRPKSRARKGPGRPKREVEAIEAAPAPLWASEDDLNRQLDELRAKGAIRKGYYSTDVE